MDPLGKADQLPFSDAGILTAKQVTAAGLHRSVLTEQVKQGQLYRISRGIYMRPMGWEDEMYLLQQRYGKGIFSYETALYLHGMTDRTPQRYTMTVPQGYHTVSLQKENVVIKQAIPKNYALGLITLLSPCGNPLQGTDLERTLCDLVKGTNTCDVQIVNQAMKGYAARKEKDIQKLLAYAAQLRVKPKILRYMEVLL